MNRFNIMKNLMLLSVIASVGVFGVYNYVLAQTIGSPNYQIENPSLDIGGEISSSPNFTTRDSIGQTEGSGIASALFKIFPGFQQGAYPGVPGQLTFTNTGGILYNALDFILDPVENASDTNYAIAVSSNLFTTTEYVQADLTLGASPVWQTYTAWGGATAQRITGLTPNTSYEIKAKARFGIDTETAYSITATAATIGPSLTMSLAGVPASTVIAGETTTVATTSNAVPFGSLISGVPAVAAQSITVATNAVSGYTSTIAQNNDLQTSGGDAIISVVATNAAPAAWPAVTLGRFGYHTTDATLCTGTTARFAVDDTYAALTTSPLEFVCSTSEVTTGETTQFLYKIEIGTLQPAGFYANTATIITTALF